MWQLRVFTNLAAAAAGAVYFRMAAGRRHGHGYLNEHEPIDA